MSEITIQLVTTANAFLLDRVADDVFDHAVRPELLAAFLASPGNVLAVAVAVADGVVVGMASGVEYVHPDKPLQLFVNEIGVAPAFQRQGLGSRLIRALLQRGKKDGCHEAWVATEVGNDAARALYSAVGGQEDEDLAVVYTYRLSDERAEDS